MFDPRLAQIAHEMNAEMEAKCPLHVGGIFTHRDGYDAKILDGQYLVMGRVSNWWSWQRVDAEGNTFGEVEHGYGWEFA